MSWLDLGLLVFMYYLGCHGVTIGFHRYFTHGSFKAKRPLRIALAVAGSMAVEGPLVRWVADHRRHHKFSDAEGDPHSPWRFGETLPALMKGLWWAHIAWMFDEEQTSAGEVRARIWSRTRRSAASRATSSTGRSSRWRFRRWSAVW